MRVSEALEYLASTDEEYGRLRGVVKGLEYRLKVSEAIGYLGASGTQDERKSRARASDEYKRLVTDYEAVCIDAETIGAKRKTAELTIEVWRSQNANKRQAGVV